MSFEEFKIKLVSVAKLPHADTYYACFEYKNHDKCDEQCVVSFNAAIQASQIRAYRKLRAFFNDFDLNIEKKDVRDYTDDNRAMQLFNYVIDEYGQHRSKEKIGLCKNSFHPFPGLTLKDYSNLAEIYAKDNDNYYKTKLEFLPQSSISNDVDNYNAYKKVISFLETNSLYIPLFLYAIYSFLTPLSETQEENVFGVKEIYKEDILLEPSKGFYHIHPKQERNCSFTNFSLWLSAKDTKKLNIAANLFLNVYSYGYSAIDNTHSLHMNISKKIRIHYADKNYKIKSLKKLHTKDEMIGELKNYYKIRLYNTKYPLLKNYLNIKNVPIIVYSDTGKLSSRSKIIKYIFQNRYKFEGMDFEDVNFAFLSLYERKPNAEVTKFHWLNINLSNAAKISQKEFKELKPCVNVIYRHILEHLHHWYTHNDFVPNFGEDKYFYKCDNQLYYHTIEDSAIKSSNYRELFCYHLLIAGNILNASFRITNSAPFDKALNAICNNDYNALIPKVDSHLDTDRDMFLNYLKTIIKEHINDSPQETVWLDEHKISAGQIEDVYSFNDKVVKEFLDKDIHNSSIALRKYLVSKNLLLKNDKRFVFNKNANSKKYYVYKIRAKYLS